MTKMPNDEPVHGSGFGISFVRYAFRPNGFILLNPPHPSLYCPTVIREEKSMKSMLRYSVVTAFVAAIALGAPRHAFAQG